MTNRRVFTGKDVQEATAVALETLDAELEDVDIRVINPGRAGIFGLGGALAEIEVAKLSDIAAEEQAQALERQRQLEQATASPPVEEVDDDEGDVPSRQRRPRQPRSGRRRERTPRAKAAPTTRKSESQNSDEEQEKAQPRSRRTNNQSRQRRQRSNNQRNQQERRVARAPRNEEPVTPEPLPQIEPSPEGVQQTVQSADEPVKTIENRAEIEKATGEIVGYLIAAMNVEVEAYVLDDLRDGAIVFEIEGADAGLLIGRRGETLRDLQFIVRMLVNRQLQQRVSILIDVESYQHRRTQKLHTIAENAARAASRGRARALDPMTPDERRIVHMALSDNPQVVTESEGEGTERHVVVKPS